MSVYIIAEAGVNHNGDIELAKHMIEVAAEAGASCVKFQSFQAGEVASRYAKKANYQKVNFDIGGDNQYAMLKRYEMDVSMHMELIEYCKQCNIQFLSTAFGLNSIELLEKIHIAKWKIPSGEITNFPYLKRLASSNNPFLLSTGMSTMQEIEQAIQVLESDEKKDITLLHCNTQYPTPPEDVNLRAMVTMRETFGRPVGYSDHTNGIEASIAAVALGAAVIEKHFTLDRHMEGPDHIASLEPSELSRLVQSIRRVELELGDGIKKVTESERENILIARKSIVAARDISAGEYFTEENITTKRPGSGISPMMWEQVVGAIAKRDYSEDELIEL